MTEPLAAPAFTVDEDGWFWYRCTCCKKTKLAALFTPIELTGKNHEIRCRCCLGEINAGRYAKSAKRGNARRWGNGTVITA